MRKLLIIALTVMLSGLSAAYAIHQTIPSETFVALPGPYAEAVYNYITVEDPYKKWKLWPGKGRLYKGAHPHGALLTTYINDNAESSIRLGREMLNGSMIVKENYMETKKLEAITVMYKIQKYSPGTGDWYWIKYDKNWKVEKQGKVEECINCHSEKKSNDYVFTGEFAKE